MGEEVWGDEEMAWLWRMSLCGNSEAVLPHLYGGKSQADGEAFNRGRL